MTTAALSLRAEPLFVRWVAAEGVSADFLWAAGDPANVLVDVARDRRASLVVVGSHHHGFLAKLVGTDVAAEVKRHAGADVLVVE